ncbi:MAG: hypothetical protein GY807_00300 [Gammaproteobacteria bacterium]|nr:hypothetical protein [Gammaproteobacteria bacterium]
MNETISKQTDQQKQHRRLESKSQKAFQQWLTASNEWVLARRESKQNGDGVSLNSTEARRVRKMEKRLDEAADTFEAARKAIQKANITLPN